MQGSLKTIGISIVTSILTILCYNYFDKDPQQNYLTIQEEDSPAIQTNLIQDKAPPKLVREQVMSSFTKAASFATPAVVNIRGFEGNSGRLDGIWRQNSALSTGSGVLIAEDGYIVTNHHVVEGANLIEVTLNDKRVLNAKLVGSDQSTDLALIKVEGSKFPFLTFGNSDEVQIGEWVLAVGNPFNLTSTVTAGIVSSKARNINILEGDYSIESFIQTDAAVNPGNSGGALVDAQGRLIGVNTAIITRSGRYEGYSFAIPANLAEKVVKDLKDFGFVQRGFLGVVINDVDQEIAKKYNLDVIEGVFVSRTNQGSAAAEAGLRGGDVITLVNDVEVKSTPELQEQIALFRPGDTVNITFIRDGKKNQTRITLKNRNNSTQLITKTETNLLSSLGMEMRNLSNDEQRRLRVTGAKITSVRKGSKIDRTNMEPGFIITKINEEEVTTVDEVIDALKEIEGKVMLEGIYEDYPGEYYYAFAK